MFEYLDYLPAITNPSHSYASFVVEYCGVVVFHCVELEAVIAVTFGCFAGLRPLNLQVVFLSSMVFLIRLWHTPHTWRERKGSDYWNLRKTYLQPWKALLCQPRYLWTCMTLLRWNWRAEKSSIEITVIRRTFRTKKSGKSLLIRCVHQRNACLDVSTESPQHLLGFGTSCKSWTCLHKITNSLAEKATSILVTQRPGELLVEFANKLQDNVVKCDGLQKIWTSNLRDLFLLESNTNILPDATCISCLRLQRDNLTCLAQDYCTSRAEKLLNVGTNKRTFQPTEVAQVFGRSVDRKGCSQGGFRGWSAHGNKHCLTT